MKPSLLILCVALSTLAAAPAAGQVVVDRSGIAGPTGRPYGPGFGGGVVVGPRDGCRSFNCPPGYRNRPLQQRYYDRYFEVPTPRYSRPGRLGGSGVIGGSPLQAAPGTSAQHRDWCADRYRSYRPADDSFQPFEGPRRRCLSPFS